MLKIGTVAAVATLALAAAGCGGDKKPAASATATSGSATPPNNGMPNNGAPNNGAPNNGWNNGAPNNGAPNNGAPNNGAPNNGWNNGAPNNGAPNNGWNNGAPNNGAPNNGAPNNGWNNGAPNNGAPNNGAPNNGAPTPPPANNGNTAQQIDPNVAMVARTALATFANTQLQPGMVPEGNAIAGNFTPGQTLTQAFTIAPGKCYSIVAAGVGPGMEVDITAQASGPVAIPGFNPQFGQAKGKPSPTGSSAVLGEKANCIKLALSPIPIQATYVITATKGSGMVAAQLYSK